MKILPINTHTFFKRAISVAEHYGFCNVDEFHMPIKQKGDTALGLHKHKSPDDHLDHHVLASVLQDLSTSVQLRKRHMLMFYTPSTVSHASTPRSRMSALTLNAVGTHDPLAEMLVLKSTACILDDLGINDYVLSVNSIGDADSSARFVREVGGQLRRQVRDLPEEVQDMVRTDVESAIATLYENRHPITRGLPSPLEFLTSPSRKYFKEVLELLEETDIPFVLDDKLYGMHSIYTHTMFEFVEKASEADAPPRILARGGRYDNLTRAYARSTVPAAGIVIAMQTKDEAKGMGRPRRKKPSACLIHIGREARIKSIAIVETFRREKIPIEQCLQYERFSEQIAHAEAHNTKYIIILGQREVHQNVAIVRNADDRSQTTIPISTLAQFVRTVS